ncbi:MAG: HAMP domain-containing sensor histidine kinase [Myxococcota bacterium]|nr:HAMP domain-containing sensor histidine kinase [Myxococcota bacterium]
MTRNAPSSQLAGSLRTAATRLADTVGSGCALVFAAEPGEPGVRLRSAAGFAAADLARAAAEAARPIVREAIETGQNRHCEPLPEFGKRGKAATFVLPLCCRESVQGAVVVGAPASVSDDAARALFDLAAHTALQIDNAQLAARLGEAPTPPETEDDLLRLSEALFAQDIELLRNNEKLGKIERLKNDFIEKMSRELRTPLNSIIESVIGVLAGEHDHISDQAKASLRTALDEGTAFQRTLQNILDLWRLKQDELPIETQEVHIGQVVQEAIFSVQDGLDDKPITIHTQIDSGLPKVRTDLAKINQLFFLLLDNAVKFTAKGEICIGARLENDRLHCSVADTGIGVLQDDQEFVYDEFFQVDAHSSSTYRGAGLGLSLVRDLVSLLKGEIAFESRPGQGTTVAFAVPVELT